MVKDQSNFQIQDQTMTIDLNNDLDSLVSKSKLSLTLEDGL